MRKICFVLTVSTGLSYSTMFLPVNFSDNSDFKDYFSKYYDVSINYLRDKDSVDYYRLLFREELCQKIIKIK